MKFLPAYSRPPRRGKGFTFVELMAALLIFALIATAGTYMLATVGASQQYVEGTASCESQVELSIQRITENIRAASAVTTTASTITITSPPSSLISGNTFTISYYLQGNVLVEKYVNNSNSALYSLTDVAENVNQFTVAALVSNPKAFQFTINVGTTTQVQRTSVAFGRNL